MIAFGTTKTRIYAGGKAGGAAATCLIASLETSKFVTSEKSRMPRHGGWDAASLCYRCVAIQQNRVRHSALYSHAQDVVPCVELHNKSHRVPRLNILQSGINEPSVRGVSAASKKVLGVRARSREGPLQRTVNGDKSAHELNSTSRRAEDMPGFPRHLWNKLPELSSASGG
jgi:hypothetical protein